MAAPTSGSGIPEAQRTGSVTPVPQSQAGVSIRKGPAGPPKPPATPPPGTSEHEDLTAILTTLLKELESVQPQKSIEAKEKKQTGIAKFFARIVSNIFGKKQGIEGTHKEQKAGQVEVKAATVESVTALLTTPQEIPKPVRDLVEKSHRNIARSQGIKRKDNGAAIRQPGWLQRQQGKDEQAVRKDFATQIRKGKLEPPKPASLHTIQEAYAATSQPQKTATVEKQIDFQLATAADSLHRYLPPQAIVQVASGMNFEEISDVTIDEAQATIDDCSRDPTQGGQTVAGAAVSGQLRYAARDAGVLHHALIHCGIPEELLSKCLINGFLKLDKLDKDELKQFGDHIKDNIHKFEILPQEVMSEEFMTQFMQVFGSAPDVSAVTPENKGVADEICELMVVAQYKALAQMAVIRGRQSSEPVPLHLTLVGQGVFKNDPIVMGKALGEVAKIVNGENVKVTYQLYNIGDVLKLMNGAYAAKTEFDLPNGLLEAAVMTELEQVKSDLAKTQPVHAAAERLASSLAKQYPTLTDEVKLLLLNELKKSEYNEIFNKSPELKEFVANPEGAQKKAVIPSAPVQPPPAKPAEVAKPTPPARTFVTPPLPPPRPIAARPQLSEGPNLESLFSKEDFAAKNPQDKNKEIVQFIKQNPNWLQNISADSWKSSYASAIINAVAEVTDLDTKRQICDEVFTQLGLSHYVPFAREVGLPTEELLLRAAPDLSIDQMVQLISTLDQPHLLYKQSTEILQHYVRLTCPHNAKMAKEKCDEISAKCPEAVRFSLGTHDAIALGTSWESIISSFDVSNPDEKNKNYQLAAYKLKAEGRTSLKQFFHLFGSHCPNVFEACLFEAQGDMSKFLSGVVSPKEKIAPQDLTTSIVLVEDAIIGRGQVYNVHMRAQLKALHAMVDALDPQVVDTDHDPQKIRLLPAALFQRSIKSMSDEELLAQIKKMASPPVSNEVSLTCVHNDRSLAAYIVEHKPHLILAMLEQGNITQLRASHILTNDAARLNCISQLKMADSQNKTPAVLKLLELLQDDIYENAASKGKVADELRNAIVSLSQNTFTQIVAHITPYIARKVLVEGLQGADQKEKFVALLNAVMRPARPMGPGADRFHPVAKFYQQCSAEQKRWANEVMPGLDAKIKQGKIAGESQVDKVVSELRGPANRPARRWVKLQRAKFGSEAIKHMPQFYHATPQIRNITSILDDGLRVEYQKMRPGAWVSTYDEGGGMFGNYTIAVGAIPEKIVTKPPSTPPMLLAKEEKEKQPGKVWIGFQNTIRFQAKRQEAASTTPQEGAPVTFLIAPSDDVGLVRSFMQRRGLDIEVIPRETSKQINHALRRIESNVLPLSRWGQR